jgi:Asp-tRNA(Asn)/Glu-tRNA(Gln) amidotransferase A subunit family amidase
LLGHFVTAVDYLKLNRLRSIVMQRFDKMMQGVDVYLCEELSATGDLDTRWEWYANMTGHPGITFPSKLEAKDGFLMPKPQVMIGRVNDESTLLALADACQRAVNITQRPPLEQFLAQKEEILAGEEFPDESKYYTE